MCPFAGHDQPDQGPMNDLRHSILASNSEAQEYDEQKTQINLPLATLMVKRGIDISGAVALILLTAPFMAMIALVIALDGGPILFAHQRIGRHGTAFGCLKFRTMILDAESCLEEYLDHHPEHKLESLSTQ